MRIFISHASANKKYGKALVELLTGIGVNHDKIIYTSDSAYGIPVGENIFEWLKKQIKFKPFVIYLLSKDYYKSVACLNEMGAAWIIGNKQAALFTPNFDINCKEFQSGALDPRKIALSIENKESMLSFIDTISEYLNIRPTSITKDREVNKFIKAVTNYSNIDEEGIETNPILTAEQDKLIDKNNTVNCFYTTFLNTVKQDKLEEIELLLIAYIQSTGNVKLQTGWQTNYEIDSIIKWEKNNKLFCRLSSDYQSAINLLKLRGFLVASAHTSEGNEKEVELVSAIKNRILELPTEVTERLDNIRKRYYDDLPF